MPNRPKSVGSPSVKLVKVEGSVPAAIAELENNPAVEYAEPNWIYHADAVPNDPRYGQLWGLAKIDAPRVFPRAGYCLRIPIIRPADDWKQQGEVGDIARHWSDVHKGIGQSSDRRNVTGARHPSPARDRPAARRAD